MLASGWQKVGRGEISVLLFVTYLRSSQTSKCWFAAESPMVTRLAEV